MCANTTIGVLCFRCLTSSCQPLELLGAQRAEAAGLQVQHVHEADEVHALLVEAVPPAPWCPCRSVPDTACRRRRARRARRARRTRPSDSRSSGSGSTVSNSSGFDRWLMSPVCSRNSGGVAKPLILSTAACSVPTTSGFAALLNPMWLSLIWTKLSSRPPTGTQLRHAAQAVRLQDAALHDEEGSGSGPCHAFQESPTVDSVVVVVVQQLVALLLRHLSFLLVMSRVPSRSCPAHQSARRGDGLTMVAARNPDNGPRSFAAGTWVPW